MTLALVGLALAVALAIGVVLAVRARAGARARETVSRERGMQRILFPFVGRALSQAALDAALRIARAEHATLVPAYLVPVPLTLKLNGPLPAECHAALPLLEAIELRAEELHVPVDTRVEQGRSNRHALRRLIEDERFDRIVAVAGEDGFTAEDVAWMLGHAPGEIVVLRPAARAA